MASPDSVARGRGRARVGGGHVDRLQAVVGAGERGAGVVGGEDGEGGGGGRVGVAQVDEPDEAGAEGGGCGGEEGGA